jgi:DNA-binding beta-propeller fold protein YncE
MLALPPRVSRAAPRASWPAVAALLPLLATSACGSGNTVYDRPDATLDWPSRREPITVPPGGMGLVSDNGSDQLSLLDLGSGHTIENVRVGFDPVGNDGPHHLAVDPTAGHVFVALSYPPPVIPAGPHAGHGSSTVPGWVQMLDLTDLHELARAQVDDNPGDIVLTADRRRVIVTHFDLQRVLNAAGMNTPIDQLRSNMFVLDADTLARIASFPVCVAAHGITVDAAGTRAYLACYGEDVLAVVHLDSPDLAHPQIERIPVGPGAGTPGALTYGPYAALLTHDGSTVLVSDIEGTTFQGKDVRIFDVATQRFTGAAVHVGASVFFGVQSPDDRYVFYPTQGPDQIVRVRTSDWQVDDGGVGHLTADQCLSPHEIAHGPDGRYYLVCEGDHRTPSHVVTFDPMTLQLTGGFDVGVYPDRVVFVGGGGDS